MNKSSIQQTLGARMALGALLLVSLASCQSHQSRAKEAYEKGEFLAAATLYEEILASDQKDAIAKEGLQKARQKLIQKRLIDVRMARLSRNYEGAFELLKSVIQDESRWQISPEQQAFATQKEEIEELVQWMSFSAKSDLTAGFPLKAKLDLERRKKALHLNNTENRLAAIDTSVTQQGKHHCQALQKQISGRYSYDFANKYCSYWGVQNILSRTAFKQDAEITKFSGIKLVGDIQGLPKEILAEISSAVLKSLQKTPYYHTSGGLLPVTLKGSFSSYYAEKPTLLTHFYEVEVPYQAFETKTYQVKIPYTDYRTEFDPKLGQHVQIPFTNYRDEERTKEVAVTKYRKEPRSLTYSATEFHLKYQLFGTVEFSLVKQAFLFPLNEQFSLTDVYHNNSHREIGLVAKPKRAPEASHWIKEKLAPLPELAEHQIKDHWKTKYCLPAEKLQAKAHAEAILLCAVGVKDLPIFVNSWANAQFGLNYSDLVGSIGL